MDGQREDENEHTPGAQRLDGYAGEELAVVLADLPGAGYEWGPRGVPEGLVLLGRDWADPLVSEPGAARRRTFRFAARRAGSYELTFDLRRPWESPDVAPAGQHEVSVLVRPPR